MARPSGPTRWQWRSVTRCSMSSWRRGFSTRFVAAQFCFANGSPRARTGIRTSSETYAAKVYGSALVAACPNDELVAAMRAEKLLAVAAGDNVVRMLPPLIIEEPEIADAIDRIDRAAKRIECALREKQQGGKEAAKVNS